MVKIRLSKVGRTNYPLYRIIVVDSRGRRDGRFIERIGNYDPHQDEPGKKVRLDVERYKYWMSKGARTSEGFGRILTHTKLLEGAATEKPKPKAKRKKRKTAKKKKS
jgi:small subunit ribosomal protein S16